MAIPRDKLYQLKEALIGERRRIQENIKVLGKNMNFDDSPGVDNEEADESEEGANELATIETLKGRVENMDAALAKVEAGAYGICESCGQEIELELLEVNPESATCRKCKIRV